MLIRPTQTFFAFLDFRNEAKILNYGRIYGGGVLFAAQLLRNFNPSLSDLEAERRARNMYQVTKGQLILKCPFGFISQRNFFQDFCPSL